MSSPKPEKKTLPSERFIATHMICVRMRPEAPTSAPLMIRTLLASTKPVIAAAMPEREFRNEITTGMSAPPIGMTMRTPRTRLTASRMTAVTSMPPGVAATRAR
jgi:hypothetical protein